MTIFGGVVTGTDVEQRVLGTARYWWEVYMRNRELELNLPVGSIARPVTWKTVNDFNDQNPEDQPPLIAIISDGLVGQPVQQGDGTMYATWRVGMGFVVEAALPQDAQDIVKNIYMPTMRLIMLQKQSLKKWGDPNAVGFGMGNVWFDENYDDIYPEAERTIFSGTQEYHVTVHDVVNRYGGPNAPADVEDQPGSSWPTINLPESTISVVAREEE